MYLVIRFFGYCWAITWEIISHYGEKLLGLKHGKTNNVLATVTVCLLLFMILLQLPEGCGVSAT